MSEHKAKEHEAEEIAAAGASGNKQQERELKHEEREEHRAERKAANKDILAKDEPFVLESSDTDPEFPALEEFEVDADGPKGSTKKHPGLIWAIVAVVAVIVLIVAFVLAGDWFTPNQAEQNSQRVFEEQVMGEDLGEN